MERASAIKKLSERGAAYGIRNGTCDGQDVFAVRDAVKEAVDRARKDSTPTLIDIHTYRFMGHSMSDAVSGTYRPKSELEEWQQRDPIVLLRSKMKEMSDSQYAKLDEELKAVVQDAIDFADASPEPPPEALWEDVLVDTTSDSVAS